MVVYWPRTLYDVNERVSEVECAGIIIIICYTILYYIRCALERRIEELMNDFT